MDIFPNTCSKNTQISNVMKTLTVGTDLVHVDGCTDGRIDMTKIIFAFRNFVNAAKTVSIIVIVFFEIFTLYPFKQATRSHLHA
jgi:hypothetical protein